MIVSYSVCYQRKTHAILTQSIEALKNPMNAPPFMVLGQYLKDLSFENPFLTNPANKKLDSESKVQSDATTSYKVLDEKERIFEVEVKASAAITLAQTGEAMFMIEVVYAGIVKIHEGVEDIEKILMVEVPFYLFFEVRNIIAHMTWQGGYSPLFLNPVDFWSMYQQKAEVAQQ